MNNIYKITMRGVKGALYASYKDGTLFELLNAYVPSDDIIRLGSFAYYDETALQSANYEGLGITKLIARTVTDKITMFCTTFREHRNSPYTPKKNEKANIAQVSVSRELLEVYFINTEFPLSYAKSINDYIKHYNYVRDLAANGKPSKSRFPDVYDRDFERSLEGETLSAYWQHLNKLGWKKTDGTWIKGE